MSQEWFEVFHTRANFFLRIRDLTGSKGVPKPLNYGVLVWPSRDEARQAIPQIDELCEFDGSDLDVRPINPLKVRDD